MSISGDYLEIEDLSFLKEPISDLKISHPLWHGLEVTVIKPSLNSVHTRIVKIFYELNRIKISEGCYVHPSEKEFIHLWEEYKKSGKSLIAFQVDLIKARTWEPPVEAKIAAALSLSGLNHGEGYVDEEVAIHKGWRGSADKVAILCLDKFETIGEGGFGVISGGEGFIADSKRNVFSSKSFALKNPKDRAAYACFEKGNTLLKTLWETASPEDYEGLVKPSIPIKLLDNDGNYVIYYAMTGYEGDLLRWSAEHSCDTEAALEGFLVALNGLALLQHHRVIHLDLKPDNILFTFRNGEIYFEINDFDACFPLLPFDDKSKWTEEALDKFFLNLEKIIIPYTRSYTIYEERYAFCSCLSYLKTLGSARGKLDPEMWEKNFISALECAVLSLKSIQIYQMGWTLLATLTHSSPKDFFPTLFESSVTDSYSSFDMTEAKAFYLNRYTFEVPKISAAIDKLSLSSRKKENLTNLILQMVHPDPSSRPSIASVRAEIDSLISN